MSGSFDRKMMSSCCGGLVSCSIGMACGDCVGELEMIGNGLELMSYYGGG